MGVENLAFIEGAAARLGRPSWRRLVVVERQPVDSERLAELADRFGCPVVQQPDLPDDAAVIVRSPGFKVPAEIADVVPTTNPAALWLAERSEAPGYTVGITGTKGKSSTTTLLADELRRRGVEVFLGGNVGTALWTRPPDDPVLTVAELSSYQAIEVDHSPELAAITILGVDHLDLHGTVAAYHGAKLNVVCGSARAADLAVVHEDVVDAVRARCDAVPLRPVAGDPDVRVANARVVAELLVALGQEAAADDALLERLIGAYPDLPGRYHALEAPPDAVRRWVDDALGSNPAALVAALHRAGTEHDGATVVAIVGGRDDRGASPDTIVATARALPDVRFVCIDEFGARLAPVLRAAAIPAVSASSLEAAVALAAEQVDGVPATVVFSPGAPTPLDQGAWKDRSRRFALAVEDLGERAWG